MFIQWAAKVAPAPFRVSAWATAVKIGPIATAVAMTEVVAIRLRTVVEKIISPQSPKSNILLLDSTGLSYNKMINIYLREDKVEFKD